MIKEIFSIIASGLGIVKDYYKNPRAREEMLEIVKAKYGDKALLVSNRMVGIAHEQQLLDKDLVKLLVGIGSKESKRLANTKRKLWTVFNKLDKQFRILLVRE